MGWYTHQRIRWLVNIAIVVIFALGESCSVSKGAITHKDIRVASGEVKEARRELCTMKDESGAAVTAPPPPVAEPQIETTQPLETTQQLGTTSTADGQFCAHYA